MALVLAAALVMTACSSSTTTSDTTVSPTTLKASETSSNRVKTREIPLQELIQVAIADIEAWWTETYPEVYGVEYEPVTGGFFAYSSKEPPPPCGGFESTYEEAANNAFYCRLDDSIMWDEEQLMPFLYETFGQYAPAFVMAHEFGHAIQARNGLFEIEAASIVLELQADCFAGAWSRHILEEGGVLAITPAELPLMVAGALFLADSVGSSADAAMAHGSGFDRLGAIEEGFNQGAARCADYDNPDLFPEVFLEPFLDETDAANEGNLPFDEAVRLAVKDLDLYWASVSEAIDHDWVPIDDVVGYDGSEGKYPRCGDRRLTAEQAVGAVVYCAADNVVLYDDHFARNVHADLGDFAIIVLFAHQWAVAFQVQSGYSEADFYTSLQASCFTGSWAASIMRGDRSDPALYGKDESYLAGLSPGDLDEALQAFLAFSEQPDEQGNTTTGNAFQRVEAFRDGFLSGYRGQGTAGEQVCARYTVEEP